MNFQDAPSKQGFDFSPMPKGTVVKCRLEVQFNNFGEAITNSTSSSSTFIKSKIKVAEGDYEGRVVYHMIGITDKTGNPKCDWGMMGAAQIKAILQSNGAMQDPSKYNINNYSELNDRPVYVRFGQERDKQTGDVRNVVDAFLSPDPTSQYHDDWVAYHSGVPIQQENKLPPMNF